MKKSIPHLLAGTALSFVLFVVPPVSVHAPNAAEFNEPTLALLMPFVGLFLVGALIAGWVSWRTSFPSSLLVFYLCSTAASLIVSQVFSSSAGIVIDGGFHEYQVPHVLAAAEIMVVLATFVLGFLFRRRIAENGGFVAAAISVWALASAAMPAAHYLESTGKPGVLPVEQPEPSDGLATLAELSSELNILHIMFDSFQSDAFEDVLNETPSIRDSLEGFVLYPEHAGYSNWTSISLPAILTGHLYFEEHIGDRETAYDLIRRWMVEDSIMARLQKRGFAVSALQPGRFFCEGATYPCTIIQANVAELRDIGEGPADGVRLGSRSASAGTLALLADLSLLRLAPAPVKPAIYNDGRLRLSTLIRGGDESSLDSMSPIEKDVVLSRNFAYYLIENFRIADERPAYKFLHFYPPHKPFLLRRDCTLDRASIETGGAEATWDNYIQQAGCAAQLLAMLVGKLKELDVYDRTMIVLQADTGLGMVRDDPDTDHLVTKIHEVTESHGFTAATLTAYAQPVLAIKPLGGRGPLAVSSELTHHRDMLSIILQAVDRQEPAAPAVVQASARRGGGPRPFVLSDALRPTTKRLAPFELFEIDGPLRDFSNWSAKGVFIRPGERAQPLRPIEAVSLEVGAESNLSVGDPIELSAQVVGGEDDRLYLFFHRTGDEQFEVIQDWSADSRARWTIGPNHRNPCVLELLLAVRNELAPPSEHVTVEANLPLAGDGCR